MIPYIRLPYEEETQLIASKGNLKIKVCFRRHYFIYENRNDIAIDYYDGRYIYNLPLTKRTEENCIIAVKRLWSTKRIVNFINTHVDRKLEQMYAPPNGVMCSRRKMEEVLYFQE